MKNNYLKSIQKYSLVVFIFFSLSIKAQYTVNPIPHQVYTANATAVTTSDDMYSPIINLPFDFNYFGTNYNQIIISTNGYIDFRTNLSGQLSPWNIPNVQLPSSSITILNSILGAYEDLNNSSGSGSITYSIVGVAPYRKFVVLFQNQPHFQCTTILSSFQMILFETSNIIDVQLIDKQTCTTWNSGRAICGIINQNGTVAFTPPGRNTGIWSAFHEGWRFTPNTTNTGIYNFIKCDDNVDGFETFNLQVAQNDINPSAPSIVSFFASQADADSITNALPLSYTNITATNQTIYARVLGTTNTIEVHLQTVDCSVDFDGDTVPTDLEDVNNDTNLANDDTDGDGLYDFIDNDDDGDLVLTSFEYVFPRNTNSLDTDNDNIPNYLDNDDDGDGILTINEDANGNNNPMDDDSNNNGIPNYLENNFLSNHDFSAQNRISIYPNPATSVLNIDNKSSETITNVEVYSIKGDLVKSSTNSTNSVDISDLENGVYFIKIQLQSTVLNYKFVKN